MFKNKCNFSALSLRFLRARKALRFSYHSSAPSSTIPPPPPQTLETRFFPISLDPRSFVSALVQCRTVAHVEQVHALAVSAAMIENLGVANKLVYIYAQHKAVSEAHALFSRMAERDNVSWSVMIGGFAKIGDLGSCLGIFKEFLRSGSRIDNFTLPFALRACRDLNSIRWGMEIHHLVYKSGLHSDVFVSAAVVDMYAKCGCIEDARKVFDRMPLRDMVAWTVMIAGYAECGNPEESLILFDKMEEEGIVPDKVTMVAAVFACAKLGAMHKARLIRDYISRMKFSLNVFLGTAMIDMYAKCGSVDDAREIFDEMRERNVITWSSMISAYGIHGRGKEALELFTKMLQSRVQPNEITFVSLLSACSHAGLVDEGRKYFHMMKRDYLIQPDVKHYTCMLDLLGRAGKLDEALELTHQMEVEKDEGIWGALLGACRIHGNIELAEKAAQNLLQLGPRNPGYYVLLSNIYANAGRWVDVANVREQMNDRTLKKIPGWTVIEINNKNYKFKVGDKTHPQSKEIYEMLKTLREKLELAGYLPDTNFVLHDVDEELKAEFLYSHSEKLAIAFGLIATTEGRRLLSEMQIGFITLKMVLALVETIGDKWDLLSGTFFTFTGLRPLLTLPPPTNFTVSKVTMAEFPALNGQSVSFAVLMYPPGSVNPLHTHPRSAELLFLVEGYLEVGFVDTTDKLYTQKMQPGDMFVFPKGLVHFQYCTGPKPAVAYSAFGSASAGLVSVPGSVFTSNIDDGILAKSFKTDVDTIQKLKDGLAANKC
ncbi:Pentatricopeptide repeat-containing protein, chloroplastic [Ananas comosus]|uniref:Pentatricopeptide repeat-containing protein, chloroplastic n=2 Tax=Ananas comosus TaxID=4615 RepID=A0A199W6L5_ANACO|nr:Pentatricopeptide repeat-containing protein, chloroplastic [Ananas comosus]